MNAKQLAVYQRQLEQERDGLRGTGDAARDAAKPVQLDQASVGRVSRMDAIQGQAMAIETLRRQELRLLQIERALERISAGEFGRCRDCDEAIDPRRLDVDPATTLCIRCAASREEAGP